MTQQIDTTEGSVLCCCAAQPKDQQWPELEPHGLIVQPDRCPE